MMTIHFPRVRESELHEEMKRRATTLYQGSNRRPNRTSIWQPSTPNAEERDKGDGEVASMCRKRCFRPKYEGPDS